MGYSYSGAVSSAVAALDLSFLIFQSLTTLAVNCTYTAGRGTFRSLEFRDCYHSGSGTMYLCCGMTVAGTHFSNCSVGQQSGAIEAVNSNYDGTINGTVVYSSEASTQLMLKTETKTVTTHCINISGCTASLYVAFSTRYSGDVVMKYTQIENCRATFRCFMHFSEIGYNANLDYLNFVNNYDNGAQYGLIYNKVVTTMKHWAFFGNTYVDIMYVQAGSVTMTDLVCDVPAGEWAAATIGPGCSFQVSVQSVYSMVCEPTLTSYFTASALHCSIPLVILAGLAFY